METSSSKLPIIILISGNGSNLQAIIDAMNKGDLDVNIRAIISNNPNAYGLERAKRANIPSKVLSHKDYKDRASYDKALGQCMHSYEPQLVVLAGFMWILGGSLIDQFQNKIINIHPSLLPKYPGLKTHHQVFANNEQEHGCTIHFVSQHLDAGPVIAQASIPIYTTDDPESLSHKIQKIEHILYPNVLSWFAQSRIRLQNNHVILDDIVLPATGIKYHIDENALWG
jgi:phosphoribosylglycinamide formyltransferase 1